MTQETMPKITKESKNKIRVEFDRTPLKERLMAKFVSLFFLKKVVFYIFRLVLLVGISYIILAPFLTMLMRSFMNIDDIVDPNVMLIPKHFNVDIYKEIWTVNGYLPAFANTALLSASVALIQMFICCLIGYGLAKFKFKGNKIIFFLVIFTMIVPHQTLSSAMYINFSAFDIFGIFQFLNGGGINFFGFEIQNEFFKSIDIIPNTELFKKFTENGVNLLGSNMPLFVLSITGLAFKNGLYIFMLRQFYQGVPDELEESAYMDGSGTFRTFLQIILPLSIPMMITVFIFAFCWQWTDDYYLTLFNSTSEAVMMDDIIKVPDTMEFNGAGYEDFRVAIRNTGGLMVLAPLLVLYVCGQRFLIQGIESSGLAN